MAKLGACLDTAARLDRLVLSSEDAVGAASQDAAAQKQHGEHEQTGKAYR